MTGSTESGKISLVLYVDVEHGVLIETLWNVKSVKLNKVFSLSRINRNIVECKENYQVKNLIMRKSINRNIVECKVQRITVKTCIVSVLIETLWNVKQIDSSVHP